MDCIVNAAWLAFYWATIEEDTDAVSALENLILDWPMDFVLITGDTPDEVTENMFKWSVDMSAKVERLRDFVGLEANNMMRIVSAAADIMKSKYVNANKKANVELVHNWLVTNIRWGAFHCPDIQTVTRHMDNWQAIQRYAGALSVIEGGGAAVRAP